MQLAVPRYSQKTFPRYRHVPNATPHPVIDPKGHSFQKPEEKVPVLPPEKWMQIDSYLYGVDLFNHGFWWEAHEAWENVWMTTPKTDQEGMYLQGLIQFSAALLKLYGGSKRGFDNLWRESQKKLKACAQVLNDSKKRQFMGIDLQEWLERAEVFGSSLQIGEGESADALTYESYPYLILEDKPLHLAQSSEK